MCKLHKNDFLYGQYISIYGLNDPITVQWAIYPGISNIVTA